MIFSTPGFDWDTKLLLKHIKIRYVEKKLLLFGGWSSRFVF